MGKRKSHGDPPASAAHQAPEPGGPLAMTWSDHVVASSGELRCTRCKAALAVEPPAEGIRKYMDAVEQFLLEHRDGCGRSGNDRCSSVQAELSLFS